MKVWFANFYERPPGVVGWPQNYMKTMRHLNVEVCLTEAMSLHVVLNKTKLVYLFLGMNKRVVYCT